jgi:hypothetical protein
LSQVLRVGASEFLRTVSFENGFHFCTDGGVYTNVTATSLMDFADKLRDVDVESIVFHYPRGDFQFWVTKTLGDEELGDRMCFVNRNQHGEQLRQEISRIVTERINELNDLIEH